MVKSPERAKYISIGCSPIYLMIKILKLSIYLSETTGIKACGFFYEKMRHLMIELFDKKMPT
jgi:hypothetical protein